MIASNHLARMMVRCMANEYGSKDIAFRRLSEVLSQFGWHMNTDAFTVPGDYGSHHYAIRNVSYSVVGGIFVAWANTFNGKVCFMAEIT